MGSARARLLAMLRRRDRFERLRVYTPVTAAEQPIYVHAKIMIVDDRVLRVGSSNMNNRSMGLDSECDVAIDAGYPGNGGAIPAIEAIRVELIAEHLGAEPDEVRRVQSEAGSLIRAIERLRGTGRSLRPFTPPEPNQLERKVAHSETLDPEHAEELFEPITRRKLLRGLPRPRRARSTG